MRLAALGWLLGQAKEEALEAYATGAEAGRFPSPLLSSAPAALPAWMRSTEDVLYPGDAPQGLPPVWRLRHIVSVYSAAYSPDGTRIVTGSDDNTARIWDAATGAEITQPKLDQDQGEDATSA